MNLIKGKNLILKIDLIQGPDLTSYMAMIASRTYDSNHLKIDYHCLILNSSEDFIEDLIRFSQT